MGVTETPCFGTRKQPSTCKELGVFSELVVEFLAFDPYASEIRKLLKEDLPLQGTYRMDVGGGGSEFLV